jgi:membrane-bound lytic murein transglycosylase B
MAPRANWKGFLRLSLITCPVALYPATSDSEKISFNQFNRNTGHRIKYTRVDADTGEEVASEDIMKGFLPPRSRRRSRSANRLRPKGAKGACMIQDRALMVASAALAVLACLGVPADAAQCGSSAAGFEAWKREFAEEARAKGVSGASIAALLQTSYATATIGADRGQRSFGLSLDQFLAKRGASTIVARGRSLKQSQAALFASIQQRYGVPPGPLLAIWGMETGFGSQHGGQNMLSAVATLAYDCRRTEYFTEQLYAALKLIDRGALSAGARGSMHGEIGQTQFLPKNMLAYGTGNLDVAANALSSTANFLKAHGWRAGAGYQPGEANFAAIQAWNAATVYQRAIALMGRQIDGGEGAPRPAD